MIDLHNTITYYLIDRDKREVITKSGNPDYIRYVMSEMRGKIRVYTMATITNGAPVEVKTTPAGVPIKTKEDDV